MKPAISVVVPAYNEEKLLGHCLTALKKQSLNQPYEIIVVNNASTDKTALVARQFGVRLVNEPRIGIGQARHSGFLVARTAIIASTDADCYPPSNWLSIILSAFKTHSDIAAVAGLTKVIEPGILADLIINQLSWFDFYFKATKALTGIQSFGSLNVAVKRKAYFQAGGFNVKIKSPLAADDLDLAIRLNQVGKVIFEPRLINYTSNRRYQGKTLPLTFLRLANMIALLNQKELPFDLPSNLR